MKTAFGARGK
jgi:hypothetical protein